MNKHINDIDEDDIKRLRDNSIAETKVLDYKMELKIGTDEEKKEFLADVTAMANTEGGIIIFGIEEGKDGTGKNTGIASNIPPHQVFRTFPLRPSAAPQQCLRPAANYDAILLIFATKTT